MAVTGMQQSIYKRAEEIPTAVMADSSDIDDLPALVESSDEDSPTEKKLKKNIDLASGWIKKGTKFLEKQDLWMRVFSLCPFLFGINNIVSAAWMKALFSAKLLLKENRQYELTYLEWQEWECVDLMDHIIPIVQKKLRKMDVLFRCLDCVDVLEDCKTGVIIDVDLAIQAAKKFDEVLDLWTAVLNEKVCDGKETAARFGVLYVIKLYHCHVVSIEQHQIDFVDEKKKEYKNSNSSKKAEELKKQGNQYYSTSQYEESIKCYTSALKVDPFHHIYFGNRAQAYNKLKHFKEALADGRRAVTLKPEFAKGHYRYSQAFYELGQLERAIKVNKLGLQLCEKVKDSDFNSVKELEEQGDRFRLAREEGVHHQHPLTSIPKELEKKLESIPGAKGDLNKKFGVEEPPHLASTSSDSDSDSSLIHDLKRKRKKSKSKVQEEKKASQKDRRRSKDMTENLNSTPDTQFIELTEEAKQKMRLEKLQQDKQEMKRLMGEGSDSLLKNVNKAAVVSYKKALELTLQVADINDLGIDSADVLTLKYAFGMAAVSTGVHKNILEGMEKFNEILEVNVRYPMAYYGLGKAYVTMNRFILALQKLQEGYTIIEKDNKSLRINQNREFWPGTRTVIEESDPICLKKLLEDLIQICHFPPPPDGVCRHHTDSTDSRTDIYRSDLDFKGLYQIFCQMGCIVSFHPNCWKDYKMEHNKTIDKDMLDTGCVTPDCSGLIIKILIERDLTKKELISEKHTAKSKYTKDKKPVVKMKSTSDHKLAKKNDKKDLRKQRRRERLEEKDDLAECADKAHRHSVHVTEVVDVNDVEGEPVFDEEKADVQPLPDVRETVVLKKDEISNTQASGKQKKNKKKKDKSKQLLSVEVNFLDRKELLGESSVLSDEERKVTTSRKSAPAKTPLLPTPQAPHEVKKQMTNGEKIATLTDQELKVDEITQNLFSYFMDFLKVHGPLAIDDSRIQQELEVLPPEAQEKIKAAGGLGDFFRQDFKFAVIDDDVISLMTDAVKARDVALKRRDERVNQGKLPQTQDAWKTVGKGNTVDSLGESVTNDSTNTIKGSYVTVASNVQNKSSVSPVAVTSAKVTTLAPDNMAGHTACLSNSNSSNSLSSTDSSIASFKLFSEKFKLKHSDSSTDPPEQFLRKEIPADSGIDALDTIDDITVPTNLLENEEKSKIDDLDDFDTRSDTKSPVVEKDKTSKRQKKGKAKLEIKLPSDGKMYPYISDSSSDISETSDISVDTPKLVVGGTPRPLKPLNRFGQGLPSEIKTDLENDITDNHSPVNTFENELKRLADDYIKKTDEKFMSELADSVVDKMYSGKSVSDMERATTLKRVSADIRKDFEKSARAGRLTSSGIWADTPASADYSKNMGKFANDFMKKHYQKDNILVSPTSDPSSLYSKKPSSPTNFGVSDSDFRINSPFNMTNSESDTRTAFSSVVSSSASTYTSGYTLFSGPSLGLDSLSAVNPTSAPFPTPSQPFIRPPASATAYYQTVPPPGPIGSQPRPPLRMPAFHTVLKIDKETQVVRVECTSVETMTDPQNTIQLEAYLQLKDEYDRSLRETIVLKDKISAEYQKLEQKYKEEHNEVLNVQKILEVEKKKWLKEKESLQVEMQHLKEQLVSKQKTETELTKKITAEQNKVKEITQQSSEQRAKDMSEIRKYNEDAELHKRNTEEQCERAKNAEIDILKSKLAAATKMLGRSQKEAAYHIQHLDGLVKKHKEDSKPVPVQLKQSLDHWKSVAQKCEEALEKVKVDYESQIKAVSDGKLMSELSPITIPSPPPIPDAIKAAMMPNSMPGKMPLPIPSMMSRNPIPFGPRHPPPSNLNTGTAARFPAPNTMAQVRPEYNVSTTTTTQRPPQLKTTAPPRPLQAAAGMVPPRPPLLGVRPPLAPPSRPMGAAPAGPQAPKTSFEKLILKLQMDFPNHNKSDFNQFIQTLRQNRGGSLSGMSMQDIITQVSEMIAEKDRQASTVKTAQTSNPSGTAIGPPPGLSSSWAFPTSNSTNSMSSGVGETFQEDEDPCAICHEELTEGCTITLECAHKFHDECIRKWFREQSTCPNCRVHSLLSDDFPSLA